MSQNTPAGAEAVSSLSLENGEFFASPSLEILAAAQNITPLREGDALVGGFPMDVDIDEFLESIYQARK